MSGERDRREWIVMVAVAALILTLPLFHLTDYMMRVATMTGVYVIASVGWTLLGGYANQISIGQSIMFGIGAYTSTLLFSDFRLSPWIGIWAGAALAVLVAAGIGAIVFRLGGHYFALATLALAEIVRIVAIYVQPLTGGAGGVSLPFVRSSLWLLQFPLARNYYEVVAVAVLLTLALARGVLRSKLGYRLRAIRDDEVAARLAGIDVFWTKMQAFALGAVLSAIGGTFYAQVTGFVDPDSVLSITVSVQLALYAIVGGAQVWWGPLLGAALLVPLGEAMTGSGSGAAAGIAKVVYGLILIAVVVLQPEGIAGFFGRLGARSRRRAPAPEGSMTC
ncbi:MAG: branched-chain amino acid ABC transporter permease [bacterium]|nr:branched-chain amino acid ABC transporter permease [bacterium]